MSAQVYPFPVGGRPRLGGTEYGEQIHFLASPEEHQKLRDLARETGQSQAALLREGLNTIFLLRRGRALLVPVEDLHDLEQLPELDQTELDQADDGSELDAPPAPSSHPEEPQGEAAFLWESLMPKLKERAGQENFDTWLSPLRPQEISGGILVLGVPNAFFQEFLTEHFTSLFLEKLAELGQGLSVRFEIAPPAKLPPPQTAPKTLPEEETPFASTKTEEPPSPGTVQEKLKEIERQEKGILEDIRAAKSCPYYVMAANFFLLSKTLLDELYRQRARLLGELPKTHRLGLLKSLHEYREAKREMERRAKEDRRPGKRGAG